MQVHDPVSAPWPACLELVFGPGGQGTKLLRNIHRGPLRVQKSLHPEGPEVCHAIILHPPSGIAGGDELVIRATVAAGGHGLMTTPGAGKWYRSGGPRATQRIEFNVHGTLEWLPQETIVFDGARADMAVDIDLAADARYLGWEVLCLGRRASGEHFASGDLFLHNRIRRQGRTFWLERGRLPGGSPLMHSPAGLADFSVCGTLLAASGALPPNLVPACRAVTPAEPGALTGITALPEIMVARYLGHHAESARLWFTGIWQLLRPALLGREAQVPRIWNT